MDCIMVQVPSTSTRTKTSTSTRTYMGLKSVSELDSGLGTAMHMNMRESGIVVDGIACAGYHDMSLGNEMR
jgi:hypothetical protein